MCNKHKTCMSKLNEEFLIDYFSQNVLHYMYVNLYKSSVYFVRHKFEVLVNIIYLHGSYICLTQIFFIKLQLYVPHNYMFCHKYTFLKNTQIPTVESNSMNFSFSDKFIVFCACIYYKSAATAANQR
jgi:hypothetical protein